MVTRQRDVLRSALIICGAPFVINLNDVRAVCQQLGFPRVVRPTKFASFSIATGPIHLDNVMCMGNKTRLEDCSHNSVRIHYCFYYQDAGVVCRCEIHKLINYLFLSFNF